jgi:hypothetical protein
MNEWLSHPAVQGAVAPFVAALIVAILLRPFRLAGLAAASGFFAAAYLLNGMAFDPLTAARKIIILGVVATVVGVLADAVASSARSAGVALGMGLGAAALWVFWKALAQRPIAEAAISGAGAALAVGVTVALMHPLRGSPVRAGAAGLGLGLGAGGAAILGASATYGLYAISIGAAAAAFLLVQMAVSRRTEAGTTFALPAAAIPMLFATGAALLASLTWFALIPLALVPLAARLPAGERWPVRVQAIVLGLYVLAAAAGSWALAWVAPLR